MRIHSGSIQRSFRGPARAELLDAAAAASGESRNALADRLLGEAVRIQRHPLIRIHHGTAGRRQPQLIGTRLYMYQIISTVRASNGDSEETAEYFGLTLRQVRGSGRLR